MAEIDSSSLIVCIQALEKAIKFNDFLSQSDTVTSDDFEEINYRYELTLNKLAELYKSELASNNNLPPLSKLTDYFND